MIWTQGIIELFRWRRQHRVISGQAAQLVTETERFLATVRESQTPPPEPPHPSEPPRLA
jgi:hypothetical protein